MKKTQFPIGKIHRIKFGNLTSRTPLKQPESKLQFMTSATF